MNIFVITVINWSKEVILVSLHAGAEHLTNRLAKVIRRFNDK